MTGDSSAIGGGRRHFDGIAESFPRRWDGHPRHPLQRLVDHIRRGDAGAEQTASDLGDLRTPGRAVTPGRDRR